MPHAHAVRQVSKIRCQLLTCSTLAVALLCETWGLMEDLSIAKARPAVRAQTSVMTLGGNVQPGLHDQWPGRSTLEPSASRPDPNRVLSDDQGRGSTAPSDEMPLHGWRRRAYRRSVAMMPVTNRYVRSRFFSQLQSSGESSPESIKTP